MRKFVALALASIFFISAFGTFAQAATPKNDTRALPDPNDVWFDPAWSQSKFFIISNQNNPNNLYNYQVKIVVQYQAGMRSDFGDVRFVTDNGITEFPYWMESKTDSVMATFWIKVPMIPGGGSLGMYVFYNNPAATYTGNGTAVFTFFDDFSSIAGWTAYSTLASVSSPVPGIMQLNNPNGNTRAWATPNVPWNAGDFVLEMSYALKNAAGQEGGPLFRIPGSSAEGSIRGYQPATRGRGVNDMPVWRMDGMTAGAGNMPYLVGNGVYVGFGVTNGWYRGVVTASGNSMRWYPNYPSSSISWTDGSYANGNVGLWVYAVSDLQVDWMFTREFANPEPIVWTDPAWNQLATMTIINAANPTTLTDYQVKVVTPLLDGMRSDFGDVRFSMDGGIIWLSYWMETSSPTSATFWVKIPTIPGNSNIRLYAYYDNPAATYIGNGNNVFAFFDDFNSGSIDPAKWDVVNGGTYSVGGGILTIASGGDWWGNADNSLYLVSKPSLPTNFIAESYITQAGLDSYNRFFGLRSGPATNAKQFVLLQDGDRSHITNVFRDTVGGGANWYGENTGTPNPGNTNMKAKFVRTGDTVVSSYGGSNTNTRTIAGWDLSYIGLTDTHTAGNPSRFDWVFARQYANPEPILNMNPVNKDDIVNLNEDTVNTNLNPFANDVEPEGNTPMRIVFFSPAQHGYAELVGTTQIRYTPNPNYYGPEQIRYRVVDTWGNGDDGYININVVNVPDAPVAIDDGYTVRGNTVNNEFEVLANDYDNDGDILSFTALSGTLNGVVYLSPSGMSLLYSPNVGFSGVDSFQYTISDGTGLTDTGTVNVTVLKGQAISADTAHPPEAKGPKSSAAVDVFVVDSLLIVVLAILLIVLFRRRENKD